MSEASHSGWRMKTSTTLWALVVEAGKEDHENSREALGILLQRFERPMREYLASAWSLSADAIDDVVQQFIADKVLEGNLMGRAVRERGHFRGFLKTSLKRYMIDWRRKQTALKRAPRSSIVSLDEQLDAASLHDSGEQAFDVAWAQDVLRNALERMRSECVEAGKAVEWELFEVRVLAPMLEGARPIQYRDLVERFGLESPDQATKLLRKAREHYAQCLRAVVAEGVRDPSEVDVEIAELRQHLVSGGTRSARLFRINR